MKRHKFSDLLLYEEKVKNLYNKYGLSFNPTNRISRYFTYLGEVEQARSLDKENFNQFIKKQQAKYYFSQFYVLEVCDIVDALENLSQDEKTVKEKLIDLAKGTYLLSEESSNNTKARDTTFELSLFSFLQKRGLDVKLCDPNPDLQLQSSNFIYNIECKRPNSVKSLEKHTSSAVKQLEKTSQGKSIPTIALSLEQILLGNNLGVDLILDSKSQISALSFLDQTIYKFLEENNSLLGKICGDKPCLVLYYLSCLAGLKEDFIMANATFITGNVFNFEGTLADSIVKDLYSMIPQSAL